jgi:hypothetical protein
MPARRVPEVGVARTTERVRAAVVDGRGPHASAHHSDRQETRRSDAACDRGPDVRPESEASGYHIVAAGQRRLREHLLAEGIVAELSRETLRRILRPGGVSWQTTTSWKASTDPKLIPKMRRVLDLYDHPPRRTGSASMSSGR